MTKYVEICKIKYILFYCKSREINLSFAILNLLCFNKNMYLHTNPSSIYYNLSIRKLKKHNSIQISNTGAQKVSKYF
jgi:hypothetical protein